MGKNQDIQMSIPHAQPRAMSDMNDVEEDGFWPLSGKPRVNVIIAKYNLKQNVWNVPAKLKDFLPPNDIDMVFTYCGKKWVTSCKHSPQGRRHVKWKKFVTDNNLQEGDACVFELVETTSQKATIKVQILRGDFPAQLMDKVDGSRPDNPVVIDL